jgi:hypothetical protein
MEKLPQKFPYYGKILGKISMLWKFLSARLRAAHASMLLGILARYDARECYESERQRLR